MVVQVRRPKAIIFDILGTATKSGFLDRVLFPFLKSNLDNFIVSHWNEKEFKKLFAKILVQSQEAHQTDPQSPIVLVHENPDSKQSLMNYIDYVTTNSIVSPPVTQLRFKVWFDGYQQSKLRTPIYSDVPNKMRLWFSEGIKFYVFSNTWVYAQKSLLKNTNHGDLTNLISGHYDNEFGLLNESTSWIKMAKEIKEPPSEILFLTKSASEARAAGDAGVAVVLVLTHRHNVKGISSEDRKRFPYIRTFNDLDWVEGPNSSQLPSARSSNLPGTASGNGSPVPSVTATAVTAATNATPPISEASSTNSVGRGSKTSSKKSQN